MATTRLGLGATYSTTYYEPFHVARLFATLDLMTKGRVAWNVVTSLNDSEAANFGRDGPLEHDLRYDRPYLAPLHIHPPGLERAVYDRAHDGRKHTCSRSAGITASQPP